MLLNNCCANPVLYGRLPGWGYGVGRSPVLASWGVGDNLPASNEVALIPGARVGGHALGVVVGGAPEGTVRTTLASRAGLEGRERTMTRSFFGGFEEVIAQRSNLRMGELGFKNILMD